MKESLTRAELAVMNLLWDSSERITAKAIRETLYADANRPQHGTVQRLLASLEEKGMLARDRRAGTHFFEAAVSRQQYAGWQVESLADGLTGGSFVPLVTHLIENDKITVEEIDHIINGLQEGNSRDT